MPGTTTRRLLRGTAAAGAVALGVLALQVPAAQAASPRVVTLSTSFVDPVQLAVNGSTVLVTDRNLLLRVGRAKPYAVGPRNGDISGVAFDAAGRSYAYATSTRDHSTTTLTVVTRGRVTRTADLAAFERGSNPDRRVVYGVPNASRCVRNALKALDGGPASYAGKVDSHPYAVASSGSDWYVADAGGNDIVRVRADGRVSLVAVLPRQPFTFSARLVSGLGLPSCMVGVTYEAEPVPTDVEVGPDGALYVSVLPGLYDLGEAGAVYRVDPGNGRATRVASGFHGAVNVAVTSGGSLYVAELLTGKITRVRSGKLYPYAAVPGVAGLEAQGSYLYASTLAPVESGIRTGPGRVLRIG